MLGKDDKRVLYRVLLDYESQNNYGVTVIVTVTVNINGAYGIDVKITKWLGGLWRGRNQANNNTHNNFRDYRLGGIKSKQFHS